MSRLRRSLSLLREALLGSSRDFTTGPIGEAVFLLAVPMVAEMAMESLFALADVYFVSRLGSTAVASVGLTESMLVLLYACAIGLGMGTTAMVARRTGEGDPEGASAAAGQAIWIGLGLSLVVAVPGFLLGGKALELMGMSAQEAAEGGSYPRVMFATSATIVFLFLLNAVFRGAGDATHAMRALWLANGLNIVLDPCLIFGLGPFPEMGLTGAAVATAIGRGTGVAYQLWILLSGRSRVRLDRRLLRFQPELARRLLSVSLGGIYQFLVATGSWLALVRILSAFGSSVVAGYTIAIRVIVFSILPAWGMANAAATLMGQNLGAGKPDRAEASVWRTGWYNTGFLMFVAVLFWVFAGPIVGNFTTDPEVTRWAISCLRWITYGYFIYGFGMVIVQAFNGAGDTTTPTKINLVGYWAFQIPVAWLLARHTPLGPTGVFVAILATEVLIAIAGILIFRRGSWRTRVI
ncbi:MAG TPA: MATE family efflux transporter [Thermoanaerobaculia bacterium]|nr:MATE family efflux transporter [Thermoanaerobaculia bacterium]